MKIYVFGHKQAIGDGSIYPSLVWAMLASATAPSASQRNFQLFYKRVLL